MSGNSRNGQDDEELQAGYDLYRRRHTYHVRAVSAEKASDQLGESFGFDGLVEFTIEAGRPDSITREKLETIKEFPVTRISVNPQTMNQDTLEIIGRRHTVAQTIEAFHLARELNYNNINMDLIVGLPGEDISQVKYTLEKVKELSPDSLYRTFSGCEACSTPEYV